MALSVTRPSIRETRKPRLYRSDGLAQIDRFTAVRARDVVQATTIRHPSMLFGFFALFLVLSTVDLVQTVYALSLVNTPVYEAMPGGAVAWSLAGPLGMVAMKIIAAAAIGGICVFFSRSFARVGWTIAAAILVIAIMEHVLAVTNNTLVLALLGHG